MIKRILFILVLCLLVLSPIVSAETLTGTIGGSNFTQTTITQSGATSAGSTPINGLYVNTFQNTGNLKSIVLWSKGVGTAFATDVGSPAGSSTPVTIRISNETLDANHLHVKTDGRIVGTGTIGYQRVFTTATPPVEVSTAGYIWLAIDSWDLGTETGVQHLYLDFDHAALYNLSYGFYGGSGVPIPVGFATFAIARVENDAEDASGSSISNLKDNSISATYTVTKPSGIGISGSIGGKSTSAQAFIYDASGNIITSETTLTPNVFNFSTVSSQVILGIKDGVGNRYNTTTLFSLGFPTPTMTPTPTVTPPGGTGHTEDTTGTFYVKNGLTQAAIADAYVEMHYSTAQSSDLSIAAYTDSNGQIIFQGMTNAEVYEARIWKAGYQYAQYTFTATSTAFVKTFSMYPDVGDEITIPTEIDVTVRVMDVNGYTPIEGAYVTARDTLTGSFSTSAQPTNASGYAVFTNVPNSANIGGTVTKTGYVFQNWNVPYQASTGSFMPDGDVTVTIQLTAVASVTPTGTIVIPTPTPVSSTTLHLTATPDSISLGDSVTLVGSASNATKLTYAGGLRQTLFYMNKNNPNQPYNDELIGVFYNVNATHWKFRTNNAVDFEEPTTDSPLTFVHTPQTNALYTYKFAAFDANTKAVGGLASDNVLVGGGAAAGSLVMNLFASDGRTGSHLMNYQLNLTDDAAGTVTEFGNITYDKDISLLRGNSYTLRASKDLYQSGSQQFVVPLSTSIVEGDNGAIASVKLFPNGWLSAGNCSVSVHVNDKETYYPIGNVQISIPGYLPQMTGNDAQSASFNIPQNTAYTVTASKSGYCSVSESRNTSTDTYQYVSIMMKYGSCVGVTPTHTPIPGLTPTPTAIPTPIGGIYNGTAAVCGVMPENPTIMDVLRNSFACNGITDLTMQNMALSMLIMLFGAIVLGRVASGIGVLAGAIIGAVVSTAMGILPFWIIIVLIIIAGLIFAGKIFWSNQ